MDNFDTIEKYENMSNNLLKEKREEYNSKHNKHLFFGYLNTIGTVSSIALTALSSGIIIAGTGPAIVATSVSSYDNFREAKNYNNKIETIDLILEERANNNDFNFDENITLSSKSSIEMDYL